MKITNKGIQKKGLGNMNKVTLIEYAKMTEQTIQIAIETARQANALYIEDSKIVVDVETIENYMDAEISSSLKVINQCGLR